jgi:hypothetical protein
MPKVHINTDDPVVNKVLILQPFGLGDVIFCQTLAHSFLEQGLKVEWPVENHYIDDLTFAYPQIDFTPKSMYRQSVFDIKEKIMTNEYYIAPIRWSDRYMNVDYSQVMRAKYDMYDLDYTTWKTHAMWQRDYEREEVLRVYMGVDDGEPYNLINNQFGGKGKLKIDIPRVENRYKDVNMEIIKGFSLFDWLPIILGAEEIHTVSTSLLYVLELIEYEKPIHLYVRKPRETNFNFVNYLFTKPYILHY